MNINKNSIKLQIDNLKSKKFDFNVQNEENLLERTKIIKKNIIETLIISSTISDIATKNEVASINDSKERFDKEIKSIERDVVTIAVFGHMSSGKSSFLNCLVGEELLTVKEERATATITSIRHIDNFDNKKDGNIEIKYKTKNEILDIWITTCRNIDKNVRVAIRFEDKFYDTIEDIIKNKSKLLREIHNFKNSDEYKQGNINHSEIDTDLKLLRYILEGIKDIKSNLNKTLQIKKLEDDELSSELKSVFIEKITFYKDIPLLKNIELIDTPGLGSNNQLDSRKSEEFISKANIVIILTEASKPFNEKTEIDILYKLRNLQNIEKQTNFFDKVFVIINKIDNTNKNRESIKKDLNKNIIDNVNIKDEHILYISSKVELNKTSDEYNILNKNNITENDLDNIKKEMYEFATKEATTSFIKEKLAIIQQIFQDTDKNFINSLGKLDESITITNHNITHFNKAKKEIKKDLESMLNGIVDEEYKKLSEESKKEKDDIFNGVNREGETKTTGITTEEYYNNNAKIKQWYKNAEDGKWDFQKPLEDIEKYFKSKKLDLYGMFYGKQFLFSMNNDFKSKSEKRKDYDKLNEDLVNAFATYMKNVHAVYSYSQNDKFEVSEILKKHIDSTKTNDYRNIAKDSFKILVDQTNKKIEKKLKEKVFNDSKTNEIINKLSIETKEIKKKYQDKYNILLNINKIKIDNIKISVTHNSDFKISIYKSIKLTMNPFTFAKKAEFGDVAAEEWKEYSSDNYSKMMDDEINIKIKKSAKETKKKINELVDKTITDIETQLEQEKKDKEKHQNKKNDIKEDKEFIQEQFTYLKTNFIKEVEIQNNELYKYNFNQNKIENKTNIKTDTRKVKVIDNFSKIISDIYCCIVKNDMTIKTTELNKLNSFLKRINTLAIKKENFNKNISKSFCDNFFNIQIKNNIIEKCSDKEREVYYGNCFDLATTNGFITKEKENILKQLLIYFDLDESIYQQNINRCTYFSDIVVFYNKTNDNHKIVIKYKHRRYTNQNGLNEKDFTKLSYQIIDKVDDLLPLEIMNIIYIGTKKELNILKRIGRYKEEENNNGIKKINITYKEIQK